MRVVRADDDKVLRPRQRRQDVPMRATTAQTEGIRRRLAGGDASPLVALRAVGVVFGPSLLLDVAAATSLASTLRALRRRRRPPVAAAAGAAATVAYVAAVRPWMARWGVGPDEPPGHAVDIEAAIDDVWPWVAQVGQDRGGFYSYEWLENLAGCGMRNADAVHPEWQHREIGEEVKLHWAYGMPVVRFDPGRAIALKGWGAFDLERLSERRTRVVARGERPSGPVKAFYALLVEIPHFVMERRMLLGIKRRAESAQSPPPVS
jgi:hypothetical protein